MKKITNKKLSLERLVVARISNIKSIHGGADQMSWINCESDLTTRPRGSINDNNCASQECDITFE